MIRATCPHCQLAQEFDDTQAGADTLCRRCGEPVTVGGPGAVRVPDDPGSAPPRWAVVGGLCRAVAVLFGWFTLVGLPVLDFGFGWRFAGSRPIDWFWPLFLIAGGFAGLGERLRGSTPPAPGATGM